MSQTFERKYSISERADPTPSSSSTTKISRVPSTLNTNSGDRELKVKVRFVVSEKRKFLQEFQISNTAIQIKEQMLKNAEMDLSETGNYVLKIAGIDYFFLERNESLPLQRVDVIQLCKSAFITAKIEMVPRSAASAHQTIDVPTEIAVQKDIGSLVGESLFASLSSRESRDFRSSIARYVVNHKRSMATKAKDSSSTLAEIFPEYKVTDQFNFNGVSPDKITFFINCRFPSEVCKYTKIKSSAVETVKDVKTKLFQFLTAKDPSLSAKKIDEFCLKVHGKDEFFHSMEYLLINYDYVRKCVCHNRVLELSLVDVNASFLKEYVNQGVSGDEITVLDQILAAPNEGWDLDEINEQDILSSRNISRNFRVKILGAERIPFEVPDRDKEKEKEKEKEKKEEKMKNIENHFLYVSAWLVHGAEKLGNPLFTNLSPHFSDPRWYNFLVSNITLANLPRETRVCLTIWARPPSDVSSPNETIVSVNKNDIPLGWVNINLFDYEDKLYTGVKPLKLWEDGEANIIGTTMDNIGNQNPVLLFIEFDSYVAPVKFPNIVDEVREEYPQLDKIPTPAKMMKIEFEKIINKDSLFELSVQDKSLFRLYGQFSSSFPKALAKYLQSISWTEPEQIKEAHSWTPLTPIQALELLDAKFGDRKVRDYAVSRLEALGDDQLSELLLQLVQVLKYEPYHDSALARFLLLRALKSKYQVGHFFFWFLKSEIHVAEIAERYGILLEIFLRNCGIRMRSELLKQNEFLRQAQKIALSAASREITQEENVKLVQEDLKKLKMSGYLRLPLDPRWVAREIVAEKSKCFKSKKKPLLILFENIEPTADRLHTILKVGDDIRQDALTLQMIRLMDKIWSSDGLDLRMQPYAAVSTGNFVGMLEVVLNSTTIGDIYEKKAGVKSVWDKNVLKEWVKEQANSDMEYNTGLENFLLSCGAYCVATYCLGIGDRHNDNIMMSRQGHLFHIDFGHFLGNFKKKFGLSREGALAFTPQMAEILDGEGSERYKTFESVCSKAFNTIRRESDLFINLFCMMLSTGIPELKSKDDIKYLRDHLFLDLGDDEAAAHFKEQIALQLNSKRSQLLNDLPHMVKNKKFFGK